MQWWKDVKAALEELGGQDHLSAIYKVVKRRRQSRNDTLGPNYKRWVSHELQENSRGRGHDCFESVYGVESRRGVWRLKTLASPPVS